MSDPNDSKENDIDLSAFDDIDDLGLDSPDSEVSEDSNYADTADHSEISDDIGDFDMGFSSLDDEAPTELANDSISIIDELDSVSEIEEDPLGDSYDVRDAVGIVQDGNSESDALSGFDGDSFVSSADEDFDSDMNNGFSQPEETEHSAVGDADSFEVSSPMPAETDAKGKKKKEKKPKEPKAKKEKKQKGPKPPRPPKPSGSGPNSGRLEVEDMFALGSAALLAVMVLVAFVFSLSTSIVLAAFVLIFGAVIVAVPLLLFKLKQQRSIYDVMLGIAAVAMTVSVLLIAVEWSRYW